MEMFNRRISSKSSLRSTFSDGNQSSIPAEMREGK